MVNLERYNKTMSDKKEIRQLLYLYAQQLVAALCDHRRVAVLSF